MKSTDIEALSSSDQLDSFMDRARAASELLKALSHETRLLILCILSQGEKTVGEIETMLGLQQAVVSQQLARLRLEQLVQTRRDGRQIYYSIANPNAVEVVSLLYRLYCGDAATGVDEQASPLV